MLTDGILMYLDGDDFLELLEEPMVSKVNYLNAEQQVKNNEAHWLDVRLSSEYKDFHLPGSINIPLVNLRASLEHLSKDKTYIIYCDTERRSSVASYLLNARDYDTYILSKGLKTAIKNQ